MREASPTRATMRFRPQDRVKKRSEYRTVQLQGRRVHTRHFLIVMHPSLRDSTRGRLGITVTKKVGNSVQRSRIKRVAREVYRRNRALFPDGFDVVLIAKRGAPEIGYHLALEEIRAVSGSSRFRAVVADAKSGADA